MLIARFAQQGFEAGLDEAGRGCLAGPVVAAAVVLPANVDLPGLNDSKQLKAAQRDALAVAIKAQALAWAVAEASVAEIDALNILQASLLAMHRAVDTLELRPEHLLVDGNRFKPYPFIAHTCVVGGDGLYASIAAASILAKTHRDQGMKAMDAAFPGYHFAQHKGYGTPQHVQAIHQLGLSPLHRRSFRTPALRGKIVA
jgi:ribonuclease HII